MARFHSYAEVADGASAQARLSAAGGAPFRPGRPLREYVAEGGWEFRMPLADELRAQMRAVAALSGDGALARIADAAEVTISLEHLRGLDLDTRIACGVGLEYSEAEARALHLDSPDRTGPGGQVEF